jgi:hypothetical protein
MADFIATRASNYPRLKEPENAHKVLDGYFWDADLEAKIRTCPQSELAHSLDSVE